MARKLETIRSKIADLQAEIEPLEEDRRTREEAADRIDRWVDGEAERINARPIIVGAAIGGRAMTASDCSRDEYPITWLAWLDPEALKARLRGELDQIAPDVCSDLPSNERHKLLKEKRAELAKLEAEEEAAIEELEKAGDVIPRRRDADPATILGTEDPEPEPEPEREPGSGHEEDDEEATAA